MARRILVVEDEAPIREMVCFVLEQNGFQPVEAEDYDSAVNQLNEPRHAGFPRGEHRGSRHRFL